jgi:outer membrane receptor protein involved in Fe transport
VKGGVMVQARTSYNAGTNNDAVAVQKGYALLDLHLDLAPNASWWTISFFAKNLADKLYYTIASDTPGIRGSRFATTPRGRQLGVQLGAKF